MIPSIIGLMITREIRFYLKLVQDQSVERSIISVSKRILDFFQFSSEDNMQALSSLQSTQIWGLLALQTDIGRIRYQGIVPRLRALLLSLLCRSCNIMGAPVFFKVLEMGFMFALYMSLMHF